jgi:hypothetical protein
MLKRTAEQSDEWLNSLRIRNLTENFNFYRFFGWTAGPLRVIIDADNECELNYFGNIIARISAQSQRPKETKPADCEGGLGIRPRQVHA